MTSPFGKAKFGSNRRTWFKLKDGESVYRILPPMGELAEDGRWSQFYSIHYGYKNSDDNTRVFQSPLVRNMKTKMVEVPDAALERINQLKAKLDEAKKQGNEELVQQLLKLVGGAKSRYNLDSNHYINVMDLQGNIGVLKIRHKCKLALDTEIKKLRDRGVEPLDPENGRFFVFSRSGTARDTLYSVNVYKKKLHVDGVGEVEQEVSHSITEDIAARCCVMKTDENGNIIRTRAGKPIWIYKEATNLLTLFKRPTADEVQRIVQEGAKAVDEIIDGKGDVSVDGSDDGGGLEEDDAPVQTAAPVAATNPVAAPVAATNPVVAPAAVTQAPAVKQAEAPKTTAQVVSQQTDEEFLKSIGL